MNLSSMLLHSVRTCTCGLKLRLEQALGEGVKSVQAFNVQKLFLYVLA